MWDNNSSDFWFYEKGVDESNEQTEEGREQ
jgi:hypothetical protein